MKIGGIPWFNRMAVGVEKAGKQLGIKASLVGPSTADAAAQVAMVEDLVNRGVSAIAVVPTDAKALVPVFTRARQRGIIILTHESPFETGAIDYDVETIDSDSYGRLAVDEMVRALQRIGAKCTTADPCGFVMLVGGLTVPLHNYWADVALKYVKEKYPTLKEVTSRLPTAESVEDSRRAVLDLVKTYGDKLDAVIGWGSLGPLGAAAAIREKGLKNKVVVGGSAIPSSAVTYLADGTMKWAQLWDPADAGFAMVYIAKQMLDGKKITPGMKIPGIGAITIKGKVIAANKILLMRSVEDAKKAGF
ncbi:MAG: substrate-binding domain-containing protein [Armatimonadota bacterium]|nr:substrate-binding domain-containing protein [Armatimonadota bacterium]